MLQLILILWGLLGTKSAPLGSAGSYKLCEDQPVCLSLPPEDACKEGLIQKLCPVMCDKCPKGAKKAGRRPPSCEPECQNGGNCIDENMCECLTGYTGNFCEEAVCNLKCQNGASCIGPDTCGCLPGYSGEQCEHPVCKETCHNGGVCMGPDTCACLPGFNGPLCQNVKVCEDHPLCAAMTTNDCKDILVRGKCPKFCKLCESSHTNGHECNKDCSSEFDPVCGTNGVTFDNLCMLQLFACWNPEMNLNSEHKGRCMKNCAANCDPTWSPVCGTDGKTYENFCQLKLSACLSPVKNISQAYSGECKSEVYTGSLPNEEKESWPSIGNLTTEVKKSRTSSGSLPIEEKVSRTTVRTQQPFYTGPINTDCHEGYDKVGKQCLIVNESPMSWATAKSTCKHRNTMMVEVRDLKIDTYLDNRACENPFDLKAGGCVWISPRKMKWQEAKEHCESQGATLFIPKGKLQVKQLGDYIKEKKNKETSSKQYEDKDYWIGGETTGQTWLNGEAIQSGWKAGQPDGQECVHIEMLSNIANSVVIGDMPCSHDHFFACQKDPKNYWLGATDTWSKGVCLEESKKIGSQCLYTSEKQLSWSDAQQTCVNMKGSLLRPQDDTMMMEYFSKNIQDSTPDEDFVCDYISIGSKCLSFSDDKLNWDDAVKACKAIGGRLAVLPEPKEVLKYVMRNYEKEGFWAGGSDSETEGSWVWVNGEPFDSQFPWPSMQPDNCCDGQHCLVVNWEKTYDDDKCIWKKRYICEFVMNTDSVFWLGLSDTVEDRYYGPFDKIWNDEQCDNIGITADKSVSQCMSHCDATSGCTAINYRADPDSECILRACDLPVPKPTWDFSSFQGYAITDHCSTKEDEVCSFGIICASDGVSYKDSCLFREAKCRNQNLKAIECFLPQSLKAPVACWLSSCLCLKGQRVVSSTHPITGCPTCFCENKIIYMESSSYEEIWNDNGGGTERVSIWRSTNMFPGYCSLGDIAHGEYSRPTSMAILVSDLTTEAVVHPISFTQIWTTKGSTMNDGAVYRMNAPGYKCLGGVAMRSLTDQPDKNKYCCIREDYLVNGGSESTFKDHGSNAKQDLSLWTTVEGDDTRGFPGRNFLPVRGYNQPSNVDLLNSEKLEKDACDSLRIGSQCIFVIDDKKNWIDARDHCESIDANLVSLSNPVSFRQFVQQRIGDAQYWLGGSDFAGEGPPECVFPFIYEGISYSACTEAAHDKPWCATETDNSNNYIGEWKNCDDNWVWVNGNRFQDFPWPAGEPNNGGGENEDCLMIGLGNFNDAVCSRTEKFICENNLNYWMGASHDKPCAIPQCDCTDRTVLQISNHPITGCETCYCDKVEEIDFESIGGEAKATSAYGGSRGVASDAFVKGEVGEPKGWHSGETSKFPQNIWYEFAYPVRILKFSFKGRGDAATNEDANNGPTSYTFWGSNGDDCTNEETWDILFEDDSDTKFDEDNTPKERIVNNDNLYKCYGFKVVKSKKYDYTHIAMSSVRMYQTPPEPCAVPQCVCDQGTVQVSHHPITGCETCTCGLDGCTSLNPPGSWQAAYYDSPGCPQGTQPVDTSKKDGGLCCQPIHKKHGASFDQPLGLNYGCMAIGPRGFTRRRCHNRNLFVCDLSQYVKEWRWVSGVKVPNEFRWSQQSDGMYGEQCMAYTGSYGGQRCRMDKPFLCEDKCPTNHPKVASQCLFISKERAHWQAARQHCKNMAGEILQPQGRQLILDYYNTAFPQGESEVKHACEGVELKMECDVGLVISVSHASYGRTSKDICNEDGIQFESNSLNCDSATALQVITDRCNGQRSCNVAASNSIFGDPCGGVRKYIEVHYACQRQDACDGVKIGSQCLIFIEDQKNWIDAKDHCESIGTNLVSLSNPNDLTLFSQYAKENYDGESFWLGGTDSAEEGKWTWVDGNSFKDFPWGTNMPNGGASKNCLNVELNQRYTTAPCSLPQKFICQSNLNYWMGASHEEQHEVSFAEQGGIAKASSSHESGKNQPMKAFGEAGFWQSLALYTVPQSLWIEFPEPLRVVKYSFTSRTDNVNYVATDGPSKYIFWASNYRDCSEESEWAILKEDNSGTRFANSNDPKVAEIENNNFYRCYGFKVTDVPGREGKKIVTIANIHFYSNIDTWMWLNGRPLEEPYITDMGIKKSGYCMFLGNDGFKSMRCNTQSFYMCDLSKAYNRAIEEIDFKSIGGEARATSFWDKNWVPSNAFNGKKGWHSGNPDKGEKLPQSLWYEFAFPESIKRFSFRTRTDIKKNNVRYKYGPTSYIFWGSNGNDCSDELTWEILLEDRSGTGFDRANSPKEEDVVNVNFYKCYGFQVIKSNVKDRTAISNVRMYLTPQGRPCVVDGISYPSGMIFKENCMKFRCYDGRLYSDFEYNKDCGVCAARNDPHFTNFDGIKFDWHGHSTYYMVTEGCEKCPSTYISAKFKDCARGLPWATCVDTTHFKIENSPKVTIFKQTPVTKTIVSIDGHNQTIAVTKNRELQILEGPNGAKAPFIAWHALDCLHVMGINNGGFMLKYCGGSMKVFAYPYLQGKLCGMCGTWLKDDHLHLRNETKIEPPPKKGGWDKKRVDPRFGLHWEVSESCNEVVEHGTGSYGDLCRCHPQEKCPVMDLAPCPTGQDHCCKIGVDLRRQCLCKDISDECISDLDCPSGLYYCCLPDDPCNPTKEDRNLIYDKCKKLYSTTTTKKLDEKQIILIENCAADQCLAVKAPDGENAAKEFLRQSRTQIQEQEEEDDATVVYEPPACPRPYTLIKSYCYYSSRVKHVGLPWHEALKRCDDMGGNLAEPKDSNHFINFLNGVLPKDVVESLWLGGSNKRDTVWRWVSGAGDIIDTSIIKPSGNGNCMAITISATREFTITDAICEDINHYICIYNEGSYVCPTGCRNGGKCISQFKCQCTEGWGGPSCEKITDKCATLLTAGSCVAGIICGSDGVDYEDSCTFAEAQCRNPDLKRVACDPGSEICSGVMVGSQCFVFISKPLTWHEADRDCKGRRGKLAVVTDHHRLMSHIREFGDTEYWVGASKYINGDNGPCPHISIGSKCLIFSEDSLSWNEAAEACTAKGGQLAVLPEPDDVLNYVKEKYGDVRFWAGGSDIAEEESWVWVNGEQFNQFPWKGGQPNNQGSRGAGQHCLVVNYPDLGYNDNYCDLKNQYICESTMNRGPCDKMCTKQYDPVCDSKGVTHGNLCMMDLYYCKEDTRPTYFNGICGDKVKDGCTNLHPPGTWEVRVSGPNSPGCPSERPVAVQDADSRSGSVCCQPITDACTDLQPSAQWVSFYQNSPGCPKGTVSVSVDAEKTGAVCCQTIERNDGKWIWITGAEVDVQWNPNNDDEDMNCMLISVVSGQTGFINEICSLDKGYICEIGPCDFMCTREYRPLCDSNNVQHSNLCMLKKYYCNYNQIPTYTDGVCDCDKPCHKPKRPVCDSNDNKYDNMCYFEIAWCKDNTLLQAECPEPCPVYVQCSCETGYQPDTYIQPLTECEICECVPCPVYDCRCEEDERMTQILGQDGCPECFCEPCALPDCRCKEGYETESFINPETNCPDCRCVCEDADTCATWYEQINLDTFFFEYLKENDLLNMMLPRFCDDRQLSSKCPKLCDKCPKEDCSKPCSTLLDPVCANNGKTYQNMCELENAQCDDSSIVKIDCDCDKPCTKEYRPVCGSNGIMYSNMCVFLIARCKDNSLYIVKCSIDYCPQVDCRCEDGFSPITYTDPKTGCPTCRCGCNKFCPELMDPVCASDGLTYDNHCKFENARCKDRDLSIVLCRDIVDPCPVLQCECSPGYKIIFFEDDQGCDVCKCEQCPQMACDCLIGVPQIILDDDGCHMDCTCEICPVMACLCLEGFTQEQIFNEQTGCEECICVCKDTDQCDNNGLFPDCRNERVKNTCPKKCGVCSDCTRVCPEEYGLQRHRPVCGSDGITYPNRCEFDNAVCRNSELTQIVCSCVETCPRNYAPVCGSDGRTYGNKCLFHNAWCRDNSLYMVKCKTDVCVSMMCNCGIGYNVQTYVDDEDGCSKCRCVPCPQVRCGCSPEHRTIQITDENGCKTCECEPCPQPSCVCDPGKVPVIFPGNNGCPRCKCELCPAFVCRCETGQDRITIQDLSTGCPICQCRCTKVCGEDYNPVCGSDDRIYDNRCVFENAQCDKVLTEKKCDCLKVCPEYLSPVCGSDGLTYDNKCFFNNAWCQDRSLYVVACRDDHCVKMMCRRCPFGYTLVTYTVDGCERCRCESCPKVPCNCPRDNTMMKIPDPKTGCPVCDCQPCPMPMCMCPEGQQVKEVINPITGCPGCSCVCEDHEICVFYGGSILKRFWCKMQNVQTICPNVCNTCSTTDDKCKMPENTMCTQAIICGSDGVTYSNGCTFSEAKCRNPNLRQVPCSGGNDECLSLQPPGTWVSVYQNSPGCPEGTQPVDTAYITGGMCCQPIPFDPDCIQRCNEIQHIKAPDSVCGSDGVKYSNKCYFDNAKCINRMLTEVICLSEGCEDQPFCTTIRMSKESACKTKWIAQKCPLMCDDHACISGPIGPVCEDDPRCATSMAHIDCSIPSKKRWCPRSCDNCGNMQNLDECTSLEPPGSWQAVYHNSPGCPPGTQPVETAKKDGGLCCQPISNAPGVCSNGCHNGGTCIGADHCICTFGWTGPSCQITTIRIDFNHTLVIENLIGDIGSLAEITWRTDLRCGPNFTMNGRPSTCNPISEHPCCSPCGWCGNTKLHCLCRECNDFRQNANDNSIAIAIRALMGICRKGDSCDITIETLSNLVEQQRQNIRDLHLSTFRKTQLLQNLQIQNQITIEILDKLMGLKFACIPPFAHLGNSDECLWLSHTTKTWKEAVEDCKSQNAYLYIPDKFVETSSYMLQNRIGMSTDYRPFVGASSADNKPFKWVNGNAISSSDFRTIPNSGKALCVVFDPIFKKLDQVDCTQKRRFICEKDTIKT